MFEFKFPDVGEGIAEGEIVKWRVEEGDAVKEDDILLEVETDKAVVELPSPRSGIITSIRHKEGDTVKVGEVLVTIAEKGEKVSKEKDEGASLEKTNKENSQPPSNTSDHYSSSVVGQLEEAPENVIEEPVARGANNEGKTSSHALATPSVRRLARDLNVSLKNILGTGGARRITEEDVRKAAESAGITEPQPAVKVSKKYDFFGYVERVPLKGVRKAIAEHMTKSVRTAAHVTHMDEADVTELWNIREKEKVSAQRKGVHITFLPFIVKAVIAALREHPTLNASMDDEHGEIMIKKYYNIGIAVDTQDGLVVPVVKNAQDKSIMGIAKEIEELADKAQTRKLDLMDMKGSSFTITNIGVIGGLHATPIINWPDVAILALGRIYDKVTFKDDKITVRKALPFSLAFDHRVLDGAEAARFANSLKAALEDPEMLLMEK